MKKILISILVTLSFLASPASVFAQSTVIQGGTGTTTVPANYVLIGKDALHLTAVATSSLGIKTNPGGLNTQLQYNNAGSFGGITGAVSDGTSVSITGAHLLNPTINGAGTGLATLAYPNTAANATITFPTFTSTLATLAGSESLTNKSVNGVTLTAAGSAASYLNGTGAYSVPIGTTYTAAYPVTLTGSAFGLAFGTTTANIWSALQTFGNASTTILSASTICFTGDTCRTTWPAGASVGGASSTVQYNANGAFAGNSGMTYTGSVLSLLKKIIIGPSPTSPAINSDSGLVIQADNSNGQILAVNAAGTKGVTIDNSGTYPTIHSDYFTGSDPTFHISTYTDKNNTNGFFVIPGGNVGINTATPATALETNGTASSSALVVSKLSGIMKANGTSAVTTAVNGIDFSLITAKTCTSGDFVSAVTAAGVFTCTTPVGASYTATYPVTLTGSAFGLAFGTSTSNTWASTQTFGSTVTANATTTNLAITGLATPAGTVLAVDPTGRVIATTTSTGGVTSVTGTYPILSTGGGTPAISVAYGTTTTNTWSNLQTFNGGFNSNAASIIYNPSTTQGAGTYIGQDSAHGFRFGYYNGNNYALWAGNVTPSGTNYNFLLNNNGSSAQFNSTNNVEFNINDVSKIILDSAGDVTFANLANGLTKTTSGKFSNATNGTDFTLVASSTCAAGSGLQGIKADGTSYCYTPAGSTYTGTYPIVVTGSVISTALASSTLTASSPLTGSFAQVGTGGSLGIQAASGSQNGYLLAADYSLIHTATTTFSSPLVYTLGTNAVTCPTCNTSSASVTSVNNGSTGSTLTFSGGPITTSGTINGEINLAHANTWTALQQFSNATTTLLTIGTAWIPNISNAVLVANGSHQVVAGIPGTDYENPLTFSTGLNRTTNAVSCLTASGSVFGCLTAADWTTFNGKQAAGNYITALTGDAAASGPGSAAITFATVNSNVGSFTNANITVNAKGLVTAAANGTDNTASSTLLSDNNTFSGKNVFANATTTLLTIGTGWIPSLGTAAGAFLAVDPNGKVIATTTPSGGGGGVTGTLGQVAYLSGTNTAVGTSTLFIAGNSAVGVGTTTPWGMLSVKASAANPFGMVITDRFDTSVFTVNTASTTGNIFEVASTTGTTHFAIDQAGHIVTGGTAPTVSACGTSPSIAGTDMAGTVTIGSGTVTLCTVTFNRPYSSLPHCVIIDGSATIDSGIPLQSTTGFNAGFSTNFATGYFNYICLQ